MRDGGGVAGSLDSQVTRHQFVSVTHCSVVVLCGHTHRSSKPASQNNNNSKVRGDAVDVHDAAD